MPVWQKSFLLFAVLIIAQYVALPSVFSQNLPSLVQAARDADWDGLKLLLDGGSTPDAVYGDGSAALHWASYHDSIPAAQLLLAAGADINITTDLGVTPLWLAAENGNAAMTRLLLGAGANPNTALLSGETAVITASRTGNAEVVRALLSAGADPNSKVTRDQTALMWAANQGHPDVVEALLESGADVNARSLVRSQYVKSEKEQDSSDDYKYWTEDGGNTALIFAARAGDLASAQLLVNAGAGVNELSAFGTSPAIMAVHGGNAGMLEYLLDSGADPESAASGHTALHAAVLRGYLAAVNALLAYGANTEATVEKPTPVRRQSEDYHFHDSLIGATPLWLAARFSEPRIMEALLAAGADINAINDVSYPAQRMGENYIAEEGQVSVLMAAVGMGHPRLDMSWGTSERRAGRIDRDREALILDTVTVAVQAGAPLNWKNAEGQTALAYARARRYATVVSFLLAAGASEE